MYAAKLVSWFQVRFHPPGGIPCDVVHALSAAAAITVGGDGVSGGGAATGADVVAGCAVVIAMGAAAGAAVVMAIGVVAGFAVVMAIGCAVVIAVTGDTDEVVTMVAVAGGVFAAAGG